MAAFDEVGKTIKHENWDKGEEVVIREMTYGESAQLTSAPMSNVNMIDMQDEAKMAQLKMDLLDMSKSQVGMLETCIVSWTFKIGGKPAPVNYENISNLPTWYGDFIAEEIDKLSPKLKVDDKFPDSAGAVPQG